MRPFFTFALALLVSAVAAAQTAPLRSPATPPQTVEITSANLHLKAFLWKPAGTGPFPALLFNHGSGGADAGHTAGMPITEAAEKLGPLFVQHGYIFLYLFRRGHGLSADQAPFQQDLLKQEEAAHGKEARQQLQDTVLLKEHLEDVLAALTFLKSVPGVDARRIAVAGHSFGGQLALLSAEKNPDVRAAVAFAAAAASWGRSARVREQLLTAMRNTHAVILLIQAENDYSTAPSKALATELERLHKPHLLKIYPPVGNTQDAGHNFLYEAIPQWEGDVFQFLDAHVK